LQLEEAFQGCFGSPYLQIPVADVGQFSLKETLGLMVLPELGGKAFVVLDFRQLGTEAGVQ
jgi:hypothetical protein